MAIYSITQAQRDALIELYIGYFNRAPEASGLDYWTTQLLDGLNAGKSESATLTSIANQFYDAGMQFGYYPANLSVQDFIKISYANALGRTSVDAAGMAYWTAKLNSGEVSRGEFVMNLIHDAKEFAGDATWGWVAVYLQNRVAVGNYFADNSDGLTGLDAMHAGSRALSSVTPQTAQAGQTSAQAVAAAQSLSGGIFTLTESVKAGADATPAVTAVYWGYNPNSTVNDNSTEGPSDGGIPVADLLSFLTSITGLDLAELGLVDDDGVGPFDNVTNLTMSMGNVSTGAAADNSGTVTDSGSAGTLTINFADGTSKNAEVELGTEYFKFLNNVLFDSEGNSRLFEKVLVAASSGSSDSLQPIKLTPAENNGGTLEIGTTTQGDDTIVAGRLELLHQAYIDGGLGYNVLEIDAKGTYAQPAAVLNVQEIRVNDLPNFYTTGYGSGDGNLGNTLFTGVETSGLTDVPSTAFPDPTGSGSDDSWIDLNRAIDLKKLVVTDQGASGSSDSGALTIVGVRNAATLRLEGGFSSGTTTIQYGQGQTGTLKVELAIGDVNADINLLQNAAVLNIDSQGVENHMHQFFAGGSVSRMIITGTGAFGVEENLADGFNNEQPILIDASANTGGVNLNLTGSQNVTFKGSVADDTFRVDTAEMSITAGYFAHANDESVKIVDTAGDNHYEVSTYTANITDGNGNSNYEVSAVVANITAGNGANDFELEVSNLNLKTGNGNNIIEVATGYGVNTTNPSGSADEISTVVIMAGNGKNTIDVAQVTSIAGSGGGDVYEGTVDITVGDGGNNIDVIGTTLMVNAGAGNDVFRLVGDKITVNSGAGNDTITIAGIDPDYVTDVTRSIAKTDGALITIDTGAGSATINLGLTQALASGNQNIFPVASGSLTAMSGSVIKGSDVTLFVNVTSDLRAANLTGLTGTTKVILDDESIGYAGQGEGLTDSGTQTTATGGGDAALTLTTTQFAAIGAANFSVQGAEFGSDAVIELLVTASTSLTALGVSNLPEGIKLKLAVKDGVTLTMTAEQLHTYVIPNGIVQADPLTNLKAPAKLVVTDAGLNFDPTVTATVDAGADDQSGSYGGIAVDFGTNNVTVLRTVEGFERPTPTPSTDTLILDTNVASNVDAIKAIVSEVATLKIVGDADAVFTKAVDLGRDETAATLADGRKGDLTNLATTLANPGVSGESDAYTIDFSALTGDVVNLTVANFQDVKQIKGNGNDTRDVRINVEMTKDGQVGFSGSQNGLKSSGVQTYVVTSIGDDTVGESMNSADTATIYVCDQTQDVTTLGLRGNYDDTIVFKQVNWGTNFVLETAAKLKADGNPSYANVGKLQADYFWTGAEPHVNAVVDIVNLDTGTVRPANAAGIQIDNADTITINANSAAVIQSVKGNSLENLVLTGPADITLRGDLAAANIDTDEFLRTLDASGVVGTFTLELSNEETTTDLSKAVVTGLDKVVFSALDGSDGDATADNVNLTLTADQAISIGAANVTTNTGVTSTLNIEDLNSQAINLTAFGVKNIGTVSIADNTGGVVTLDPTTVLGNISKAATSVVIKSSLNDTTVEMSAAQFNQLAGNGTVTSVNGNNTDTNTPFKSTLVLTGFGANTQVNLTDVDQSAVDATTTSKVDVVLHLMDVVASNLPAANAFTITGDGDTKFVLEVEGNVNLAKATFTGVDLTDVTAVKLAAGSVLTLTAAQLAQIPTTDANGDGAYDAWTALAGAKLNIVDVDNGFAVDLNKIQAAGVDIGTLTLKDYNTAQTITFGAATLGGADAIITPTKGGLAASPAEPTELTNLSLSAAQYNQLADGTITGDGKVFITALANNSDVNGDNVIDAKDVTLIDTTNVSAPKGTVTLGSSVVTLADTSSIAGFEIVLANGQLIRFSTAEQAAAKITETSGVTGVQWLFETFTAAVDTSKYSGTIDNLFIDEALLVSQPIEEDLWTSLAGTITVQKINGDTIPELVQFNRVNTFEALTNIAAGVNYDDNAEFSTMATLAMNLEGEVSLGNILLGDTLNGDGATPNIDGKGYFQSLTINSYLDTTTIEGFTSTGTPGIALVKNTIGNISLNAGSVDELVAVTVNTYANADNALASGDPVSGSTTSDGGFYDPVNVNGIVAERDGMAVQVGTISFGANVAKTATLTVTGSNNVTIAGVNIADAEINFLTINAEAHVADVTAPDTLPEPKLQIGNIMSGQDLGAFGTVYVMDGFTATATTDLDTTAANELLALTGGVNDLTAATPFDIDAVAFSASSTLTLTAAQVVLIGTQDTLPTVPDGKADDWSAAAGTTNVLNITEVTNELMALNLVAATGVTIGTITIKDTNAVVTLNPLTNLGGATSIVVPAGTTLNLTAKQFMQLDGAGTITGAGTVNITDLTGAEAAIDLSGVTAVNGTISLSTTAQDTVPGGANDKLGGTDVELTAAANLRNFSVTLIDRNGTATDNELAGQTIRFATAVQAERVIKVVGADSDAADGTVGADTVADTLDDLSSWTGVADGYAERDTNVVWLFNTITGTANAGVINTNGYAAALGRVWVNDALVDGQNIEAIFSSPSAVLANPTTGLVNLNSTTIVRVVNTTDLATLLPENVSNNRIVEIEAFTQLPGGLVFSNPDKLVDVENVTIDLGGAVTMGGISIDDIVAVSVINPDGNEFGTLTINSLLANSATHYLLPEDWDPLVNPLPTALPAAQQVNTIGNIASGPTRGELSTVVINATGIGLNAGTITFTEDSATVSADSVADFVVTGSQNINIASVNTADAEITAVTVTSTGYTGVLTAPGTSPAFALNNTQTLTFVDADTLGTITLGRDAAGAVTANAGVAGNELSFINATGYLGTLNLGILAQLDSTNDTADLNNDGDLNDTVGGVAETRALTFTSGQGITTATLAAANGLTPTLNAGSEWSFDYTGADAGSYLRLTPTVTLSAGSTLRLNNVPLVIEGAVNLSQLVDNAATTTYTEGLFITGGSIEVLAGATLTLTAAQVAALAVDIIGAGTVKLVGDASNLTLGANLKTSTVDISALTLIASPTTGFDADATVALTGLVGATVGAVTGLAQTVVGSANADAITITSGTTANDVVTGGAGNDAITLRTTGNTTVNVDAGSDTITGLNTGDILVVTAGATATAATAGFVATADTVVNGTANLSVSPAAGATGTINMALAGGSAGFNLTGRVSNTATTNDVLIGSARADVIDGGNTAQIAGTEDTLTGNGGNDTFHFVVGTSTPRTMTQATPVPGVDRELVTVNSAATVNGNITVNYTLNGGAASSVVVAVLAGDATTVVAAKIASALNLVPGFTAIPVGSVVTANNVNASSLTITSIVDTGTTGATATPTNGTDQAQQSTVTIGTLATDTVVAGEIYTVTLTPVEISSVAQSFSYTAGAGQTVATVLAALDTAISAAGFNASVATNVLTVEDGSANDGGFSVSLSSVGGFSGSGASVSGAIGANIAAAAVDLITDFAPGADKIDLDLVAGSATNYAEAVQSATYAAALTAANTALDGVVRYYLTSVADNDATAAVNDATGLLFFDANSDGNVDGVVALTGISSANFAFTDIQA